MMHKKAPFPDWFEERRFQLLNVFKTGVSRCRYAQKGLSSFSAEKGNNNNY